MSTTATATIDLNDFPPEELSVSERLALMPADERAAVLSGLTPQQTANLKYDWEFWRRPDQTVDWDDDWSILAFLGGRGSGKTRCGSEAVREFVRLEPGTRRPDVRIGFVAPTPADARDIMIEGTDGIMAVSPPSEQPIYEPTKRRLTWPNGTVATVYSGAEPGDLRGATLGLGWLEEPVKWQQLQDAFDNYQMSLRGGASPKTLITSTPNPHPFFRDLVKGKFPRTLIRRVSTYRNIANLPEPFVATLLAAYEGTRLGRQELHAEILDQIEGAIFHQHLIDQSRLLDSSLIPPLVRIGIGMDPTGSASGDEAGIVAAGMSAPIKTDGFPFPVPHFYILDDLSIHGSPEEWAARGIEGYYKWDADRIFGERNFGGDMVESTVRNVDYRVSYQDVTASRGKLVRAEPVAALYEKHVVHHVGSAATFARLEEEMTTYVPGLSKKSPNRMDALVWVIAKLAEDTIWGGPSGLFRYTRRAASTSQLLRTPTPTRALQPSALSGLLLPKRSMLGPGSRRSVQ